MPPAYFLRGMKGSYIEPDGNHGNRFSSTSMRSVVLQASSLSINPLYMKPIRQIYHSLCKFGSSNKTDGITSLALFTLKGDILEIM